MTDEDTKSGFSDRLRSLIRPGQTRGDFAKEIGISLSGLNKWLAGATEPGLSNLLQIARARDISLNWLITGIDGDTWEDANGPADIVAFPRYSVVQSAGGGADTPLSEEPSGFIGFEAKWLRTSLGLSTSDLIVLQVSGDSMEPTLQARDLVLVDTAAKVFQEDGIYVLKDGSNAIVKRLQKRLDGCLLVKSDNPAYEDYELPASEASNVQIIGKVHLRIGEL